MFDSQIQPNLEPTLGEGLILWEVNYKERIDWRNIDKCLEFFSKVIEERYYKSLRQTAILGDILAFEKQ